MLANNSANRDPKVFPDPDKFDIGRRQNRHIAFAAGPHFCLGAMLARQEAQAMFRAIITRLPRLELAEEPVWKTTFVRALRSLRVRRAA
jgi:cytochrome P450